MPKLVLILNVHFNVVTSNIHFTSLVTGDLDNVRQAIQCVQDDVKNKQRDLDFITNQQNQILEALSGLKDSMHGMESLMAEMSEMDSPNSEGASRVRRRQVMMHPLSECAEENQT